MSKNKSEHAPPDPNDPFAAENNGSWWVLDTRVSKEKARGRWPDRPATGLDSQQTLYETTSNVAEAHFEAINVEDVGLVSLGSCVEVESAEDAGHNMVATVEELFQDPEGNRWMNISWFYKQFDTSLKCKDPDTGKQTLPMELDPRTGKQTRPLALDPRMLFKANGADNKKYKTDLRVDTIGRLVTVEHRVPGGEKPQGCDYYWSMYHDRMHNTFVDSFEEAPPSKAVHAASEGPRVLNTLELYCGCGGLSFADRHTDDVIIETKWAVDYERSMIETFKANYPYAHGHIIGVDEFLELCKHWKRITDKFPEGWVNPKPNARQMALCKKNDKDVGCQKEVERILCMIIVDKGMKGKTGQGKGHQLSGLKADDTWLEFGVQFKGEEGKHWVQEKWINCDGLLAPFVQKLRASNYIPLPGDVDIIMGGPPCQGVSGLNRHGKTKEIIDDPRNRQVTSFYETIEWFNPSYVLMENVLDIFKKGDGLYAKWAATKLLNLDYQTRTGVIAAAHHGAPQGRWRAFMWGAKSGKEQLPPFPEPTFAAGFACGVPKAALKCVVGFQSTDAFDNAHKMTFLGDIFSDLPEVSNFASSDRGTYESKPKTPMQLYLRRDPPEWAADRYARAENAVRSMASTQEDMAFRLKSLTHLIDPALAVGASYLCAKGTLGENEPVGNRTDMFAAECIRSTMQLLAARDKTAAATFKLTLDLAKSALSHRIGKQVLEQNGYRWSPWEADSDENAESQDGEWAEEGDWVQDEEEDFTDVKGDLSDHRPLVVNADDFLRCASVPVMKAANFRDFPGVISHRDETCCSGSTHAATYANAKNAKATACGGGGTRTVTKKGNTAAARVDHADNGGWRGPSLKGCVAFTRLMPTGDLLCPRWCITYKKGKSEGRHGCYGRMWFDEIQSTVVGRAEPHNLRLVHPYQHRVVTIRENARCQGFPDYFTFVGLGTNKNSTWVRHNSLTQRYQQLGNAVSPLVADALGRCLAAAAVGKAPVGAFVISAPSAELDRVMKEARQKGLRSYVDKKGVPHAYMRHIDKLRKLAADSAVGLAEALKVLIDDEENIDPEGPAMDEEETDGSCRDTAERAEPKKKKKKSVAAEKAPKKKTGDALGTKAKGAQKVKA